MLIQSVTIVLLVFAFLVCFYNLLLACFALITRLKKKRITGLTLHNFAIVIPAHNEEKAIENSLESCTQVDYPSNQYEIFVVADNCTDQTAQITREYGVTCLERSNEEEKGKGFALAWALPKVLSGNYDAVVILDADCRLEPGALQIFSHCLAGGDKVIQTNFTGSNIDDNPISYAESVGNIIEKELFYEPKSHLGLAVFLQGTGMVFHREILQKYPWQAHSIVEDVEYSMNLIKDKVPIKFIKEVKVVSKYSDDKDQMKVQRLRWASGNVIFGKKYAFKLLVKGFLDRNGIVMDAGWTLLTISRPLILLEFSLALLFTLFSILSYPGIVSTGLAFFSFFIFCGYVFYFSLGIILLGITRRRLALLLFSPLIIMKLMSISLLGFLGSENRIWARTPR